MMKTNRFERETFKLMRKWKKTLDDIEDYENAPSDEEVETAMIKTCILLHRFISHARMKLELIRDGKHAEERKKNYVNDV